jgi:hypothetical protein
MEKLQHVSATACSTGGNGRYNTNQPSQRLANRNRAYSPGASTGRLCPLSLCLALPATASSHARAPVQFHHQRTGKWCLLQKDLLPACCHSMFRPRSSGKPTIQIQTSSETKCDRKLARVWQSQEGDDNCDQLDQHQLNIIVRGSLEIRGGHAGLRSRRENSDGRVLLVTPWRPPALGRAEQSVPKLLFSRHAAIILYRQRTSR